MTKPPIHPLSKRVPITLASFEPSIVRITHTLTANLHLQQDLAQVARVWLWRRIARCPGHSRGWYCKDCLNHLCNWLRGGRSLDAFKRRGLGCPLQGQMGEADSEQSLCPFPAASEDVRSDAAQHDAIDFLTRQLNAIQRKIFTLRLDEYTTREIARILHISQSETARAIQAIAAAAVRTRALC